ncbi:MAG TPA: hypothetical protein VIV60_25020 [Polyangiaceae bacterium]
MSLNRFVGLGIFALSSSVLITIAACDDSSTASAAGGSGNTGNTATTGNGGSSNTAATGNGGTSTGSNNTAKGGTSAGTTAQTGQGGSGNSNTSTGNGTCSSTTNLIAEADKSDTKNWIGGDQTSTEDNPCGVQGAIYVYGDTGVDTIQFNSDDSVQSPGPDDTTDAKDDYKSSCADGKCCIKGKTNKWPKTAAGADDYKASVWGGGIGISLGDPGGGGAKTPYAGPATGLAVTLSGSLNGQVIRIGYTQSANDASAPFKEVTKVGTTTEVPFSAVTCPAWAVEQGCLLPGDTKPYDLHVQIVGGDAEGDFEVCIDSVTPLGV